MGPLVFLPALFSLGKSIVSYFKKQGHNDKVNKIQQALDVLGGVLDDAEADPELKKMLIQKDIEFDKQYTERVKASLDVVKTEAQSEDTYIRRARPTWLYGILVIMFIDFCLFPIFKINVFDYVPEEIYGKFINAGIAGFLGYGVLRTVDKGGLRLGKLFGRKQ